VLESLEAKKFHVFLGGALERYETIMADDTGHAQMLVGAPPPEISGWLRKCDVIRRTLGPLLLEIGQAPGRRASALNDDSEE
jgi:hypothetical protein